MNVQRFAPRAGCAAAIVAGCLALAGPADAGWGCSPPVGFALQGCSGALPAAALYADGTALYALTNAAASGDAVSVINPGSGATTATIPVGINPDALAGAPGCQSIFVANDGALMPSWNQSTISGIDTAGDTVSATLATSGGPFALALSPSCQTLYVGDAIGDAVSVLDTSTDAVTATIPVGSYPAALAVSPAGSTVFAANVGDGTVSVIDASTDTVTATVAVGSSPDALAVSPDGSTLYVANSGSDDVSVIDTATDTVTATIAVGNTPDALTIAAPGVLLVGNSASSSVSVIDTATESVAQTVNVGSAPNALAASATTGTIFSLDASANLAEATFGWTSEPTVGLPGSEAAPQVGDTLTAAPGTWIPSAVSYQWNAGGQPIAGATGSTFTVTAAQAGEPITVTVTNRAGSETSAATADVVAVQASPPATSSSPPATTSTAPKTPPTPPTPPTTPPATTSRHHRKRRHHPTTRHQPRHPLSQHLTVVITGPARGATYFGVVPTAHCVTHTNTGHARCRISERVTRTTGGGTITYSARARGSLGARATATLRIHTADLRLGGLRSSHGVYVVKLGNTYTLSVASRTRPLYVDAAVAPQTPSGTHDWFRRAATTHGTPIWRLRVYLPQALGTFPAWNIGIRIGGRLEILRLAT